MDREVIYGIVELQSRLVYWQQLLRLRDWDIDISIKRMAQFEQRNVGGEIHTYPRVKRALIYILDPADHGALYPPAQWPQNMELTLIHELMHLSIHDCTVSYDAHPKAELLEERAVSALARAFYELHGRTQS